MRKISILLICIGLSTFACKHKKDDNGSITKTVQADRSPLVKNWGNNVMMPRIDAFNTSVNAFDSEVQVFVGAPSLDNLKALRIKFFDAYTKWQYVAPLDFGPSSNATILLETTTVNAFPSDTTLIKNKISQGATTITSTSGANYSGFPAIDYLLYAKSNTDQQIVDLFTSTPARGDLLKSISARIKTQTTAVNQGWIAGGGNFITLYTDNTGLDLSSSTSQTINMMVADLENVKNYKLGLPISISQNVVVSKTDVHPFSCEAYHSDSSLVLAKASIESLRLEYMGISSQDVDGYGLDDYLEAIGKSSLNSQIKTQIALVQTKLNAISDPISIAVQNADGKQKVNDAYTESLNLLTLLKVDLASAVGVMISYGDQDGD